MRTLWPTEVPIIRRPEANQPFASHDGLLLVYNGELYNAPRAQPAVLQLVRLGHWLAQWKPSG